MAEKWINEGPDKRFDPFGIVSWLQRKLSVVANGVEPTWEPGVERKQFTYWDGVREYVANGTYKKPKYYHISQTVHRDGKIVNVPVSPEHPDGLKWEPGIVSMFRFGWRLDPNATPPTYIFGAAWKRKSETHPMEKGFMWLLPLLLIIR
ncbi:MAG: hypothetical protein U1E51_30180 [Candidatus Binatia bacterium]|nr:hypothetical protein [Candidatus Binatia bacterium]